MADTLAELLERFDYTRNAWQDIHAQGAEDMRFVSGNPWNADDQELRKGRPTIAPDELTQYRNQVTNSLMANPRGCRFAPTGNGASEDGARFYQNKWREIEYRSKAPRLYIEAADNALQRSYGYVRVNTRYASPRSANQDLWIEGFPDPDVVLPDPDFKSPDLADMQYCFVREWKPAEEFQRSPLGKGVKLPTSTTGLSAAQQKWFQGNKVLEAEYWTISTRKRQLLLAQAPLPQSMLQKVRGMLPGAPAMPPPLQVQIFRDEYESLRKQERGWKVLRELRDVDYPSVKMYRTNGLEILHEQDWAGQYIPIAACFGKVLYVPNGGQTERVILSMTRLGRDPWKAYCYACSQQLEVLGKIPKASAMVADGQLSGFETEWQESAHKPKTFLRYHVKTAEGGEVLLPPPTVVPYSGGQELESIELVKEGFRRSIQSSIGSNFLPTQAQKRNEKSGVALDKIDQMASVGTFHFVYAYENLIERVGVIGEDLMDKIHDYQGETGIMEADQKASIVPINDPSNPDAFDTKGDYLVTVSTAPSSDSEREAAQDFTDGIVGKLPAIAQVTGPQKAAAILAKSVRMRNLGPLGDQLADLIEPMEFRMEDDGKLPPAPELAAALKQAQGQLQQMQQQLQSDYAKEKAKQDGQMQIKQADIGWEREKLEMELAAKIEVARITAAKQSADLEAELAEERLSTGVKLAHEVRMAHLEQQHERDTQQREHLHDAVQGVKDRAHERLHTHQQHQHAVDQADQAGVIASQAAEQAADLAPSPEAGA